MIYDVHVYDAFASDFDNEGLVGALTPASCAHDAVAGNLGELVLTHPRDEAGKWTALVRGNIIKAWTRVRTVAEIDGGNIVTSVEKWTVKESSTKAERAIYNKKAEGKKLGSLKKGENVLVVQKPADAERVKVKSASLTGWADPAALEYETTEILPDDPTAIEDVYPAWGMKEQLFRIYDEERSLTGITAYARPIFGDLLSNLTVYKNVGAVTLKHAAEMTLERCVAAHDFTAHTNIADTRTGVNWRLQNPVFAFFDPEEGMVARWACQAVIDNYEITLMKQAGKNRGMSVEYGKNLTGVTCDVNDEEVITCVLPTGVKEDGGVLYLTDDADELNSGNWIYAENAGDYPNPHVYHLECEDCTVSEELGIEKARERMLEQAQELIDSGVTLPTVNIKVTFAELGATEEYAAWKELLHMDLYDKVRVSVPRIGLDALLDVVRVRTDCITGRTLEAEIGALSDVQISIANYQISGISGGKIFAGTITAPQLGSGIIHATHITANSIYTDALQARSVTAEKIAAKTITGDLIDADQIDARHIKAGAIDAEKIHAGSITADRLAAKLITAESGLIADGAILAAHIASLNADVINAGTLSAERLLIKGADGLFYKINAEAAGLTAAELTEDQYKNLINGTVIVAKSITADQIKAGTITALEINVPNLFAAQATIDQINAMDITGNNYLKLMVGDVAGGINLLRDSGTRVENSQYLTATYTMTDIPEAGETVTVTLYESNIGGTDEEKTWNVFHGNGLTSLGSLKWVSTGRYTGTFPFKDVAGEGTPGQLRIYAWPQLSGRVSYIGKIKMERGTRSTEWTPSPLDPASAVIAGSTVYIDEDEVSISTPSFNVNTAGAKFNIPGSGEDGEELVTIDAEGGLSAKKFTLPGVVTGHEGGIYTVGTGGDYADLAEAFAEISGRYLAGDVFFKMLDGSGGKSELRGVTGPGRVVITPINMVNNDIGDPWVYNGTTMKTLNALEERSDDFSLTATSALTYRYAMMNVGYLGALGLRPGTKLTFRASIQIGSGTAYPMVVAYVGSTYVKGIAGKTGTDTTNVTEEMTFEIPADASPWDDLRLQFRVSTSNACTSGAVVYFRNPKLEIGGGISAVNGGRNACTLGGIELSGCAAQVCLHSMIMTGAINARVSAVCANRCTFTGANGLMVWGGSGAMWNCYGACPGYAARAGGGGAIEIYGSAPSGNTAGLIDNGESTGETPGGGTPVTGATEAFKAASSGTYSGSAWWTSDAALRQGYTGTNGELRGAVWFTHSIDSSAITKMTLRLRRVEGYGKGGSVNVKIFGTNSTALSGSPATAGTAVTGTIGPGKVKTFDVTSLKEYKGFVLLINDGAVMSGKTYSTNYARFTGTGGGDETIPLLTITHT